MSRNFNEKEKRKLAIFHGCTKGGEPVDVQCLGCGKSGKIQWYSGGIRENNKGGVWLFGGLEFDHIIPYKRGGKSTYENMRILCRSCNHNWRTPIVPVY